MSYRQKPFKEQTASERRKTMARYADTFKDTAPLMPDLPDAVLPATSDAVIAHPDTGHVLVGGKSVEISTVKDRSISPERYKHMQMNSVSRTLIPPKLDNDALVNTAEYYLSQCTPPGHPGATYESTLLHAILPELIKRIKS